MADGTALVARERITSVVEHDRTARIHASATEVQGTRNRGASRTLRALRNWNPALGSATTDLPAAELRTLRSRSRDALRGNLIGRAALTRCRTNIVGTGLMCRPAVNHQVLGIDEDAAEAANQRLASVWERWAEEPAECDIEATLDFYGLTALALLSAMASGDVFALTPSAPRAGGVADLKVQLIEADRISNPNDAPDTPTRVDGIEIRGSTPVGCWIRSTHPGDRYSIAIPTWSYYPFFGGETGRRRVLHVWNDKERPGQVRGAPYLAPILEPLKQLDRFGGAELMAAVIGALVTVFIERDKDLAQDDLPAFGEATQSDGTIALGNAAVVDLAPGEKANLAEPGRPNQKFDPFFVAIVKQIGAAIEIPLDELLLHYQSSYSAARAAMLQAWRFYTLRRWSLTQQFCQPLYGLLIDEEVAAGRLSLPGYSDPVRRRAWTRALWIGPARGSMDEGKEADAARTRIEIGVSNEAMETAAMSGEDWSTVYAQRLREINRRKADGTWTPPHTTPRREAAPARENPGRADADDADDEQDEAA